MAVDGKAVPNPSAMLNVVAAVQPGSQATLNLLRNGSPVTAKLTVGKRPKPQHASEVAYSFWYSESASGRGVIMAATRIPISYSTHSGIASRSCETASGGVTTAATTNEPTIT